MSDIWTEAGFDSAEEWAKAQTAKIERLEKQVKDKDNYIQDRSNEIGSLRGNVRELEEQVNAFAEMQKRLDDLEKRGNVQSADGDTASSERGQSAGGDRFDQMDRKALEESLSDEQAASFEDHLKSLPEQGQRLILSDDRKMTEALRGFLRGEASQASDSVFKFRGQSAGGQRDVLADIRDFFSKTHIRDHAPSSVSASGPPPREALIKKQLEDVQRPPVQLVNGSILQATPQG